MQFWIPFAPEQASTVAGRVDALYLYLVAITLFFTVTISLAVAYFAIRYRRVQPNEVPRPIAGSLKLEALWTVIPFLIAMTIFAWGASVYFSMYRIPEDAIDVYVVGKQWMWKFQHMDGQREINELHVPIGTRIRLTMTTEDVIHSFYVPAFRIKMDVVPGRYTYTWFEATQTGRFHLFCAEYCGTNHSGMVGSIVVMEPAEYQAWLSGGATDSPASQGARIFQDMGCVTCHREDAQGRGPLLDGLFGRERPLDNGTNVLANEDYIRESIRNPQAKVAAGFARPSIMPTYTQNQISEEQLLQIMAYIRSLAAPQQQQGGTTTGTGGAATTPGGAPRGPIGIGTDTELRSNPVGPTQPPPRANQSGAGQGGGRPGAAATPGSGRPPR